jgi:hypothetical protein
VRSPAHTNPDLLSPPQGNMALYSTPIFSFTPLFPLRHSPIKATLLLSRLRTKSWSSLFALEAFFCFCIPPWKSTWNSDEPIDAAPVTEDPLEDQRPSLQRSTGHRVPLDVFGFDNRRTIACLLSASLSTSKPVWLLIQLLLRYKLTSLKWLSRAFRVLPFDLLVADS